jgi:hypothetical protein
MGSGNSKLSTVFRIQLSEWLLTTRQYGRAEPAPIQWPSDNQNGAHWIWIGIGKD